MAKRSDGRRPNGRPSDGQLDGQTAKRSDGQRPNSRRPNGQAVNGKTEMREKPRVDRSGSQLARDVVAGCALLQKFTVDVDALSLFLGGCRLFAESLQSVREFFDLRDGL